MAMKKTQVVNGVSVTDSYIRIYNFNGSADNIEIEVEYKADEDAPVFATETFSTEPSGGLAAAINNLQIQLYLHLKKEDKFSGAVDV